MTPVAPPAPQPGFDVDPPAPTVLPGHPAEVQGPTVLHQDRDDDSGTRSNSQRARQAARQADPSVPAVLPDADWEAHHLINIAGIRGFPDLIAAAARAGWRPDDKANVAPLPASPEAQRKLKAAGIDRPVHDSGHRNWNVEVRDALQSIETSLEDDHLDSESDAYARRARAELERLQEKLRTELRNRDGLTDSLDRNDVQFS